MSEDMLNAKEATQYDRQIRLWGLDAQKRIRNTRVLFIGLGGFGVETCKNIILAGIKAITLLDDHTTTMEDLTAQFFLRPDDVGRNRAEACAEKLQALNPLVAVTTQTTSPSAVTAAMLQDYDIVCVTKGSLELYTHINEQSRIANIRFFAGDVFGLHGVFFSDQLDHEYIKEHKSNAKDGAEPTTKQSKHVLPFATMPALLAHTFKGVKPRRLPVMYVVLRALYHHLATKTSPADSIANTCKQLEVDLAAVPQALIDNVFNSHTVELNPAAAILGGVLGGEIIKVVSGKGVPIYNTFVFDATTSKGSNYSLGQTTPIKAAEPVEEAIVL
eukprot:TRINITY_DN10615_c0_g1_i2.p1 TRINITY_DN10615_c0_g1~~TRINITY_DN10615_c0_g1_i2.p1  ORF type:complete len:330 (+),score=86.17 TRINITY_DN10615_c0_g1_i2:215-1204(+)